MLRNTNELQNYVIHATDGELGHVRDSYFDDDAWVLRYLVVETGSWMDSRMVLISPISVQQVDRPGRTLTVSISMDQVRQSPGIDTDMPVSRQHELQYMAYYGYPAYWAGLGLWGESMYPYALDPGYSGSGMEQIERDREESRKARLNAEKARRREDNPHLRSCKAVKGYHLHAEDGDIGHVAGFLVDERSWAVRYLVVDTSNWWMGHQVLLSPLWVKAVSWSDRSVTVDLQREDIKTAPAYDPAVDWTVAKELSLHRHYRRERLAVSADAP